MTNSNQTQAILTKKIIYEVKFAGVPTQTTREAIRVAGMDYRYGQWSSVHTESHVASESEVVAFITGKA